MMQAVLLALGLAGVALPAAPARADPVALPPPGREPWRAVVFPKIPRHTRYEAVVVDGVAAVRADADCSASGLYLELHDVDLARTPRLAWRWRVLTPLDVADERTKAGDDFAARVYLTFALDEARASLVERLRRRLAVALFGEAIASSSLTWVWASRVPPGTRWDSPYAGEVKLTALASGPGAGWREETVDVVAEYRRRFDRPPAPLQAIALMTDADGVCGRARAEYAELRFLPAAR